MEGSVNEPGANRPVTSPHSPAVMSRRNPLLHRHLQLDGCRKKRTASPTPSGLHVMPSRTIPPNMPPLTTSNKLEPRRSRTRPRPNKVTTCGQGSLPERRQDKTRQSPGAMLRLRCGLSNLAIRRIPSPGRRSGLKSQRRADGVRRMAGATQPGTGKSGALKAVTRDTKQELTMQAKQHGQRTATPWLSWRYTRPPTLCGATIQLAPHVV